MSRADNVNIPPQEIADHIYNGLTITAIAALYNMPISSFYDYINRPEVAPIVFTAQQRYADIIADNALQVLEDLPQDDTLTPARVARAREISNRLAWLASKRCPRVYGDRVLNESSGQSQIEVIVRHEVIERPQSTIEQEVRPLHIVDEDDVNK